MYLCGTCCGEVDLCAKGCPFVSTDSPLSTTFVPLVLGLVAEILSWQENPFSELKQGHMYKAVYLWFGLVYE